MATSPATAALTPARRAVLNRRSLLLAYATAGYNLIEGIIAYREGSLQVRPLQSYFAA